MITRDEVLKTAYLARIKLQESEIPEFQKNLSNIFEFIETLNEINTEGVEPTSQVTGMTNHLRKDKIQNYKYSDKLLKSSPHDIVNHQVQILNIMGE